jgi:hypothetical protein
VHASAFGTFVLALVHGLAAGNDTQSTLVRGMYVGTAAVLLGAVVYRMSSAMRMPTLESTAKNP